MESTHGSKFMHSVEEMAVEHDIRMVSMTSFLAEDDPYLDRYVPGNGVYEESSIPDLYFARMFAILRDLETKRCRLMDVLGTEPLEDLCVSRLREFESKMHVIWSLAPPGFMEWFPAQSFESVQYFFALMLVIPFISRTETFTDPVVAVIASVFDVFHGVHATFTKVLSDRVSKGVWQLLYAMLMHLEWIHQWATFGDDTRFPQIGRIWSMLRTPAQREAIPAHQRMFVRALFNLLTTVLPVGSHQFGVHGPLLVGGGGIPPEDRFRHMSAFRRAWVEALYRAAAVGASDGRGRTDPKRVKTDAHGDSRGGGRRRFHWSSYM